MNSDADIIRRIRDDLNELESRGRLSVYQNQIAYLPVGTREAYWLHWNHHKQRWMLNLPDLINEEFL